ncbi:hypothetical protein [Pseudoalteromonas luteoviolacea]|uniref:hypothetical protein n=1 Tax=Pseudoalteromonas luteoviolacea TaxID=43657 RepID=UPI00114EC276|nr:hypothetical protein [Pseudoalteromonas luteoviolacea]TQF71122.1 hypothetical protein FLM44_08545 [Pseudoalteromonas luteoviolacea]
MLGTQPARERELSEGLQRQRRNLILSSVAVLFFVILGIDLEQVSILGNSAKITKPQFVPVFLILVHLYLTLRFWQYEREENKGRRSKDVFYSDVINDELSYFKKSAQNKFSPLGSSTEGVAFIFPRHDCLSFKSGLKKGEQGATSIFSANVIVYANVYGSLKSKIFVKDGESYSFVPDVNQANEWRVISKPKNKESLSGVVIESHIEISFLLLILSGAKAGFAFVFAHSFFSDYWLPKILSILALLVGAWRLIEIFA